MPADVDKAFYSYLDKIANTGDEDAVAQNKRIKEAEFAEDSREPTAEEEEALKKYVEQVRRQEHEQALAKKSLAGGGSGGDEDAVKGPQYHVSSMLPPVADVPPANKDNHSPTNHATIKDISQTRPVAELHKHAANGHGHDHQATDTQQQQQQ